MFKFNGESSVNHYCYVLSNRLTLIVLGAIQVLRNADGGGGVSTFPEKSVTKV